MKLSKFECLTCGYIYDPNEGDFEGAIEPKVPFNHLPEAWVCPDCGGVPDNFEEVLEINRQSPITLCQKKFPCFREDLWTPGNPRK
jgi:rubredoxin